MLGENQMNESTLRSIASAARCGTRIVGIALFVAYTAPALAVDLGDYRQIQAGFNNFLSHIGTMTSAALAAPGYADGVDMMWGAFAAIIVIRTMVRFALSGVTMLEILEEVLNIFTTRALMATYGTLTSAIWEIGTGVGAAIQASMIGTSDLFFGPAFIAQLIGNISMPDASWTSPAQIANAVIASLVLGLVSLVLGALSFIVSIWGVWGYALAKIIGYLFLPFLLFERLMFLFDGWLRFFLGFVVYMIVARVNTVLVVAALALYFGFPFPPSISGTPPIVIPSISSLVELLGLFVFAAVGIVALLSTGRFASAILAGAGGGGFGLALQSATKAVAKMALAAG